MALNFHLLSPERAIFLPLPSYLPSTGQNLKDVGRGAGGGVHGGGSPIMEEIAIYGNYDIQAKKKLAKDLAGIKE